MIFDIASVVSSRASERAFKLMCRYGAGKLPIYPTDVYSLAHWKGFSLFELDKNHRGVELTVEKNMEDGLVISYNPKGKDIELTILYAIGLEELGYLPWNEVIKEYTWGSVVGPIERAAAITFANQLMSYCKVKEFI